MPRSRIVLGEIAHSRSGASSKAEPAREKPQKAKKGAVEPQQATVEPVGIRECKTCAGGECVGQCRF